MSETPKRFTLRGRIHSPQELRLAKDREEYAREVARLPGEGLHEYVRRVGLGEYQLIRTVELNSINDENSRLRRELDVARNRLRANPPIGETATQRATREHDERMRRRALMLGPTRESIAESLRGIAIATEERLMVGGPQAGRVLRFRESDERFQISEDESLDMSDISSQISRRDTVRTTVYTYVLFRRTNMIPLMIVQDLLNSPPSVQDQYVAVATDMAGMAI